MRRAHRPPAQQQHVQPLPPRCRPGGCRQAASSLQQVAAAAGSAASSCSPKYRIAEVRGPPNSLPTRRPVCSCLCWASDLTTSCTVRWAPVLLELHRNSHQSNRTPITEAQPASRGCQLAAPTPVTRAHVHFPRDSRHRSVRREPRSVVSALCQPNRSDVEQPLVTPDWPSDRATSWPAVRSWRPPARYDPSRVVHMDEHGVVGIPQRSFALYLQRHVHRRSHHIWSWERAHVTARRAYRAELRWWILLGRVHVGWACVEQVM